VNPVPSPEFKLSPEAEKLIQRMKRAVANYPEASQKLSKMYAETGAKLLVDGIKGSAFTLAPLSPGWAAEKARKGLDSRILIAAKAYIGTIKAGRAGEWWSVQGDGRMAGLLEYGTKRMPPRPHIRPMMETLSAKVFPDAKGVVDALFGR